MPGSGTFFEEGASAFAFVLGGAEAAEEGSFEGEGFIERPASSAVYGFDGRGEGEGWHRGEEFGQGLRSQCKFLSASGDNFVDEANAKGFRGVDDGAREDHFERGAGADEARQALGAAVSGDEAELDLGLAEARGGGGDAEGTGHGEFAAAAEGEAVDAGDDGLAEGFYVAEDAVSASGEEFSGSGVEVREFTDICAGREGFAARSAE